VLVHESPCVNVWGLAFVHTASPFLGADLAAPEATIAELVGLGAIGRLSARGTALNPGLPALACVAEDSVGIPRVGVRVRGLRY
jgi:hypothetical protein